MDLDQDVSHDVKNAIAALDDEHQDAHPLLTRSERCCPRRVRAADARHRVVQLYGACDWSPHIVRFAGTPAITLQL